jgi:hypothetical protein
MPSTPRPGVDVVARLALATALLWLACSERPQGGDGALHRERFAPKALQATPGGQWSPTKSLATARWGHTATLLPSGKVLVLGDWGMSSAFAEVYEDTGAREEWRPVITAPA